MVWFYQFSSILKYLSVENVHSLNVSIRAFVVQQKSVPYALFSASSQLSRHGAMGVQHTFMCIGVP